MIDSSPPGAHDPRARGLAATSRGWEIRATAGAVGVGSASPQVQLWHPEQQISVLLPAGRCAAPELPHDDMRWVTLLLAPRLLQDVLKSSFGLDLPGRALVRAVCRWYLRGVDTRAHAFELALRANAADTRSLAPRPLARATTDERETRFHVTLSRQWRTDS